MSVSFAFYKFSRLEDGSISAVKKGGKQGESGLHEVTAEARQAAKVSGLTLSKGPPGFYRLLP
jgi:hypothetical protein